VVPARLGVPEKEQRFHDNTSVRNAGNTWNGRSQPFMVADMTVDPKTNRLYVADG
jgi:hypothetical protein